MNRILKFVLLVVCAALACGLLGGCFVVAPSDPTNGNGQDKDSIEVCYYFDSGASANGDGSLNAPFGNLDKISELDFSGGEKVLLKSGSAFTGTLRLIDISGTEKNPVTVGAYGDERDGMPKINGHGTEGGGVIYIENCNFLTVKGIEVYDDATTEGDRRGVLLNATGAGDGNVATYTNIKLDGLYIHDICGITDKDNSGMSAASKMTGGVHVWSVDGYGRFDGLTINDCRIDNVDNVGIATWRIPSTTDGKISPYSADFGKYSHINVLISGNEISHIGKNAIFARNLKGGFIERNVMYETATTCVSGNTICTSYVHGTVIQFNEGYYNRASARPNDGKLQDGCMLDADLQSRDTVWQYNYSHDNAFGLFLNCTTFNGDVKDKAIVRYNLSVHDQGKVGIVYINYATAGIDIYNNTFIISSETSPTVLKSNASRNYSFYNNIIYNLSPSAKIAIADTIGVNISDNLVFNAAGASIDGLNEFKQLNSNGVYSDPLFVKEYSDSLARIGSEFAQNFKLCDGSPALGAGRTIPLEPNDFFGHDYVKSIGFCC